MKKFFLLVLTILIANFLHAQIDIYMSELIGKSYKRIVDKTTGEFRVYLFKDADGDGWAEGVQQQFMPDPEDPSHQIPVYDYFMEFKITVNEQCGNCMIFELEDDSKRYFFIDHIEGDFWIQETDEKFKKFDTTWIFRPEVVIDSAPIATEVLAVSADTPDRYYSWGEAPDEGGWVIPEETGQTFTGESVSSILPEDENFDYIMENAFDDNPYTSWFSDPETNEEYPNGESITFSGVVLNESIWILNGMQYSEEDFENNSRVKTLELYVNGNLFALVTLIDQMGPQIIELPGINEFHPAGNPVTIEFRIVDVYPGKEYPEAGISEIYTVGG